MSLGLGQPSWKRFTTWASVQHPRHWLPLEVWDKMDQALLGYSPVVIAPLADPSGEVAEALEFSASDPFEQFCHIGHKLEWHQFCYVRPLTGLPFGHYPKKLGDGHVPFIPIQRPYLGHPTAANEVG